MDETPTYSRYQRASLEEVEELKRLVKGVAPVVTKLPSTPVAENPRPPIPHTPPIKGKPGTTIFDLIGSVDVTREAFNFDSPVQLLWMLMPEVQLYPWQKEELMRSAGYLTTKDYNTKTEITDKNPYQVVLSCANGSGKDMIIIAAFAVWFAMKKARNRVIITSSSFNQAKNQTEVHIRELVKRVNAKFGRVFRHIQFHYVIPELGSEIQLFVTDEASRAEGYHPFPGGEMALIINEAKSVKEEIFDALSRCTGYSHWLEVSSPGPRSGHMFRMAGRAIHYPNTPNLGQFYFRRVTAFECPHLSKTHIDNLIYDKGENSPLVRSSIYAEFADYDEPVVVTEAVYDKCYLNPPNAVGNDIGIGLDLAGGGDEDACFVRKGNVVIHKFFFRQSDTDLAADLIDKQLLPWKSGDYYFRADNGGIGQSIIDKLAKLGWRVRRTNNQSPAFNKREFLNLGAEQYFYVKRRIELREIVLPDVEKLRDQLTTRRFEGFESTQGKYKLESKPEARAAGRCSPDRADAFVLCFASYKPNRVTPSVTTPKKAYWTIQEVMERSRLGTLRQPPPGKPGLFSLLNGKI